MKIKIINTLFLALLAMVISTSVLAEKNDKSGNKPISYLKIIATIGPLAYLSDATIIVKNAKNKVIAKGKTNFRGATSIKLSAESLTHQPLKIISSGGQIVYVSTYDITKMKSFRGNLGAVQTNMTVGSTVVISLDFMSTIANGLVTKKTSYADALSKVRDAFDIPNKVSNRVLSYTNQYVALKALEKAAKTHKGYNNYVNYIINKIKFGNSITELKPSLNPIPVPASVIKSAGLKPKSAVAPTPAISEVGGFPTCPAIGTTLPGPTPTSNGTSTSVITDFASLLFDHLLFKAGFGTTYNPGVNGLIGTALTLGATNAPAINSGPSSAYTAISSQLNCISSQVDYLAGITLENSLAVDQSNASACTNDIDLALTTYSTIITMAIPTVNITTGVTTLPSQENSLNPLNFDPSWTPQSGGVGPSPYNTYLNKNYASWGALMGQGASPGTSVAVQCGPTINGAIFQPVDGDTPAWTDYNQLIQTDNVWYTQSSVQALQYYLNYWETYVYYMFVLFNEYLNLNQAPYIQSSPFIGTIEGGSACDPSITSAGGTFCQWANNFKNAYPPTLYSDEIAIPSNGLAVIPYPTSQALNLPATSSYSGVSGINANYFGNEWVSGIGVTCSNYAVCNDIWYYGDVYSNGSSEPAPTNNDVAATAPSSAVYNPSLTSIFGSATTEANKTLLNAQGGYSPSLSTTENSSIETYTTPQVPHTQVITSTQLPNLGSLSNGQSALTLFYNAINQDNPTSPLWSGLTATEIAYFTSDNIVTVTDQAVTSSFSSFQGDPYTKNCTSKNSVGSINGQNCNQLQVQMAAYLNGSSPPQLQNCGDDECTNQGNPLAATPIMAQLLGRTWWSGASAAASDFIAPTPLTPAPAPTIFGASINGASVDVGFFPLSSTTTPTITSYVATCQNSNGSVSVSGTSSPIEVIAPAPVAGVTTPAGGAITCFVQALNGGGSGYPSASVTAAVGALPPICNGTSTAKCSSIISTQCDIGGQYTDIQTYQTAANPVAGSVQTGNQCGPNGVENGLNYCDTRWGCIYEN